MITKELLKKVKQIQIHTKRIVNDALGGEYRSSFRGRGMEFEEVREYLPGDEIRTIDWNVTARTGTPHVKNFREERELVVMLLVDISPSSEFGTVGTLKKDVANEMCAVLAFSAINNNDKVGLILFSDKIEKVVPPRKGKKHVLRVIRELLLGKEISEETSKKKANIFSKAKDKLSSIINGIGSTKAGLDTERRSTNINQALDYLNRVMSKKCVVFLVSDFLDSGYEDKLRLTNKKHDLVVVVIEDPIEKSLPKLPAIVELEDAETGKLIEIDLSSNKVRTQYAKQVMKRRIERYNNFKSKSIDTIHIDISKPYVQELLKFFKMRETRR